MFEVRFHVREYEIDSQGVVNHALYVNYFEHARSFFLKAQGYEFSALVKEGLHLMVAHMSLDFKYALRAEDEVVIRMETKRHGAKLHFLQTLSRGSDDKLCVTAETHIICVKDGRLTRGEFFDSLPRDTAGGQVIRSD